MSAHARINPLTGEPVTDTLWGHVRGGRDGNWVVFSERIEGGLITARCAVSCLVEPRPGDRVMLAREGGSAFILAILERDTAAVQLRFPGDVRIQVPAGAMTLTSAGPMTVESASALHQHAPGLRMVAGQAELVTDELKVSSSRATVTVDTCKLVARAMDSVIDRVSQRSKVLVRWVEELESLQAGQLLQKVRQTFSLDARHTVVNARKDVKIDGERIHMG